ncbi:MAG: hypothetical protein ACI4C0_02480 [Lachnospiraceae bacterium]
MLNKFKQFFSKYAYIFLPIGTLLCLAGFIGSYLFPNEVLDTYKVNVTEEEGDMEFVQFFTGAENEIGYIMETDGRPMKGFQIGISKNGQALEGTELVYRVYDKSSMTLLDEEVYDLGACLDGQYPYLPFGNELCTGKIYITFTYRANGNTEPAPGIFMNHSEIPHVATYVDGEKIEGNLKCYYIYSHNTYPFLYDSRVMLCVFLAATACVAFPAYSKKKEVAESDEEK